MLVSGLCRTLRRWSGLLFILAGSLSVLLIFSRETQIPELLLNTKHFQNNLRKSPSGVTRSQKMNNTKTTFSRVTEGNLSSWVQHLCPHYHAEERRIKVDMRLAFKAPSEDTIFFTQTSCSTSLLPREACAVESAALHHPTRPILVLFTAPYLDHTHPMMEVLSRLPGVRMAWLDLDAVFTRSPLATWHSDRLWMLNEKLASTFISDAARAELLRVHGGTYVDLDVITLRRLPSHTPPLPWVTRVDSQLVNAALTAFPKRHPFMERVVADIPSAFDDSSCCSIGPALITKNLRLLCAANQTNDKKEPEKKETTEKKEEEKEKEEHCQGLTIYPPALFYPLHFAFHDLKRLVREEPGYGAAFLNTTQAYTLHLFNSLSRHALVHPAGHSILAEAFRRNCPRIHAYASATNIAI